MAADPARKRRDRELKLYCYTKQASLRVHPFGERGHSNQTHYSRQHKGKITCNPCRVFPTETKSARKLQEYDRGGQQLYHAVGTKGEQRDAMRSTGGGNGSRTLHHHPVKGNTLEPFHTSVDLYRWRVAKMFHRLNMNFCKFFHAVPVLVGAVSLPYCATSSRRAGSCSLALVDQRPALGVEI